VAIWITDPDPDCDTGKTCLDRGMHCPSASGYRLYLCRRRLEYTYLSSNYLFFVISQSQQLYDTYLSVTIMEQFLLTLYQHSLGHCSVTKNEIIIKSEKITNKS